ncbi:hypothetical protein CN585_20410 [Bacillus toyonensis]|uniref:Uncharacterized protein n=1 Tax=Bacillus toyonensis TaxID=155322 RepID=A0A2A8HBN3_9BACI|nr:hypothetical protein CN585_20410 [Bacillus toyonensis]
MFFIRKKVYGPDDMLVEKTPYTIKLITTYLIFEENQDGNATVKNKIDENKENIVYIKLHFICAKQEFYFKGPKAPIKERYSSAKFCIHLVLKPLKS